MSGSDPPRQAKTRKKPPIVRQPSEKPVSSEPPQQTKPSAAPAATPSSTRDASQPRSKPPGRGGRGKAPGGAPRTGTPPAAKKPLTLKADADEFVPPSATAIKPTPAATERPPPRSNVSQSAAIQRSIELKRQAKQQQQQPSDAASTQPATKAPAKSRSGSKANKQRALKLSQGHTDMTARIIDQITGNSYDCMICYVQVSRKDHIWSCNRCYSIFHFKCIRQWSTKSVQPTDGFRPASNSSLSAASSSAASSSTSSRSSAAAATPSSSSSFSSPSAASISLQSWTCPGCRFESVEQPLSVCYCRKQEAPAYDPFILPHSCGEVCTRPLKDAYPEMSQDCPHRCVLQCHPGICPPCPALGFEQNCFCGRTSYILRCCEGRAPRSCEAACDRLLNCGIHRCTQQCHGGDCAPCAMPVEQRCFCGAVTNTEAVCGSNSLDESTGGHFSCDDPCNKALTCGNHNCTARCHSGPCQPCSSAPEVIHNCPCGRQPVPNGSRNSCLDPVPLCQATCNKLLNCGVHRCTDSCHHADCAPCQASAQISCRCGRASSRIVCGSMTEEFRCAKKCSAKMSCGRHQCQDLCCSGTADVHACYNLCNKKLRCRQRHQCPELCHTGNCPPCSIQSYNERTCQCGRTVELPPIPCNQAPAKCPHPCNRPHECEHPPRHGCYRGTTNCPPCIEFVAAWCMCGHMQRQTPCHQQGTTSCGRICGLPLKCGAHACTRTCHKAPCEDDSKVSETIGCPNPCGRELKNCSHKCLEICHPGQPCPTVVCSATIQLQCNCGRLKQQGTCGKKSGVDIPLDPSVRVLPCDDSCLRAERNRNLALAFGIEPFGASPLSAPAPSKYAEKTLELASTCPLFVESLEKIFANVINTGTEQFKLPPMNNIQRRLVYEIAAFYRLETHPWGSDPSRCVVLGLTPKSAVPPTLLSSFTRSSMPTSLGHSGKSYYLLIYELPLSVRTHHIASILVNFQDQYVLRWLDDSSGLLIFPNETMMRGALYVLEAVRIRARECKDEIIASTGKLVPVVERSAAAHSRSQQRGYVAPTAPWATLGEIKVVPNRITPWERAEQSAPSSEPVEDPGFATWDTPVTEYASPTAEDWEQLVDEPEAAGRQIDEHSHAEESDE